MERKITAANGLQGLVVFEALRGDCGGGLQSMNGFHHDDGNGDGFIRSNIHGRNCFSIFGNERRSFRNALLVAFGSNRTTKATTNAMGRFSLYRGRRAANEPAAQTRTDSKPNDQANWSHGTQLKRKKRRRWVACDAASCFNGYLHFTLRL
jgi:hypothetical protein